MVLYCTFAVTDHSTPISRRTALKVGSSSVLAAAGLSSLSSAAAQTDGSAYGEPPTVVSSEGPNYGALDGYDDVVTESDADRVVETADELESALDASEDGDVVFVPSDVEIDTGSRYGIEIPDGVTLAGDRGVDGSPGGLVYTDTVRDSWPYDPWLFYVGSDARVTGLRIRGKYWDRGQFGSDEHENYVGGIGLVVSDARSAEIDNCELYGWGFACVMTAYGADDTRVHHCDFHDTLRWGTGYGVSVNSGHCEISHSTFNRNRHAVACSGDADTSYEAHHNVVGPYSMSHVFDVHRPGGDRFDIHHNTVRAVDRNNESRPGPKQLPGVAIRGVPDDEAWIHHNWFYNPNEPRDRPRQEPSGWSEEAIIQVFTDDWNNVDCKHNSYGESEPEKDGIGAPHSEKVQW